MDITGNFLLCVQTQKKIDSDLGLNSSSSILRKSKKPCEFIKRCKQVLCEISQLRDFLLEHRKDYLNLSPSFVEATKMTEDERDAIDAGAQSIIKKCNQLLIDFKREINTFDDSGQCYDNNKAVLDVLDGYLKSVCKIYTSMKNTRAKWSMEKAKMSKLESNEKSDVAHENSEESRDIPRVPSTPTLHEVEIELSQEEVQMFEEENQRLYNDLNSINDEVQAIQRKVVRIAELQEIFTDKVLEQSEDIERISTTIVGTTENLKDANTQIRQAIQSNATFRIYILFFIIVISFTLLFLNWYND